MTKSKGFVYRGAERSVEGVTRRAKQASSSYDSYIKSEYTQLKVKEGEVSIRILPPTWEDMERWGDSWEIQVWLHYNIGSDSAAYLCLEKMLGKPCPCCEARAETRDEDEKDQLRPAWRGLAWALDRGDEKAGPQVWNFGGKLFRDIVARSIDKKTNTPILLDDPEEGYDINFNREGTNKENTNYLGVEVSRDPSPIHNNEKLQDRWVDYIMDHPLPDVLQYYDYDYIQKVLMGKSKSKTSEEANETSNRRNSRRSESTDDVVDETESRRGTPVRRSADLDETEGSRRSGTNGSRRATVETTQDPPFDEGERGSRVRRTASEEPAGEVNEPAARERPSTRRAVVEDDPTDSDVGDKDAPPETQARRGLERLRSRTRS